MELTLATLPMQQVSVTCDSQFSHTFSLLPLVPKEGDETRPQPLENPIRYGEAIFAALFPANSPARRALNASPDRLILVADDALQAIPWEYAHNDHGFLAAEIPFVRGLPNDRRIPTPALSAGLHILAVPSDPLDKEITPLNIDGEWLRLTEIVREIDSAMTLERVRPPTQDRLGTLAAGQRDLVVHFMGHGGQGNDGARLLFEHENGQPDLVPARSFATLIRRRAFLVTLNACVSATPGRTEFDNLAAALVHLGVPYALGMRFSIADDDARDLSRTLYSYLARGESVEEAVRAVRATLARSPRRWAVGVPVLYTALDQPADGFQRIAGVPTLEEHQPKLDVSAIPRAEGTFQGRRDELVAIGTGLTGDSRPRVLTIHALGGQGKTALAREAVERFGWASSGGVWAIALDTLPTRAAFVAALARFLNLDPASIADPAEVEKAVLARLNQRTLLVLDNAETLVQAVERQEAEAIRLAGFLREDLNGTRAQLLVTSREVLGWPGEESFDLGGLSDEEGADLFRTSAPTRRAEIDEAQAQALSSSLFGHPLSLRLLAGAFDASQTALSALVADYEQRLREAEDKYKDLDHRHRSIRAAIDTSARALPDDLRDLLSGLWIFHAPFLREIAEAIFDPDTDYPEGQQSPVYDRLYQLWRRGLLARETPAVREDTVLFYRLLPAVRLYAEQMPQAHERAALLARFGAAYAALARQLYQGIDRSGALALVAQQTADDLTRGLDYVEAGSEARGYYLLHRGRIASRLGDRQSGLRLTERALELAQGHFQRLELEALNNLAIVYQSIGQPERARDLYEQALPIRREVSDRAGEATTLNNLASVYSATGQPTRARELYEQALPITREVGDRTGEAITLSSLGLVYRAIGQPTRARELYEQALPIQREVGDRAGEATTLNNLGMIYHAIGQTERARELYEQALPIRREVGDRAGEATTLNNLAGVYHAIGQTERARELYKQALPITREVGDRAGEAATLNNLAALYFQGGDSERSLDIFMQVVQIYREIGAVAEEAAILFNAAVVLHQSLNRTAEAIPLAERSIAILKQYGLPQSAAGATLAQHEQFLAEMQGSGAPSGGSNRQPAEQLAQIVAITVAAMTTRKELLSGFRAAIDQSLQEAQTRGADWQIEVEFLSAVLALLDGGTPSLPDDHPYAAALQQILDGVKGDAS